MSRPALGIRSRTRLFTTIVGREITCSYVHEGHVQPVFLIFDGFRLCCELRYAETTAKVWAVAPSTPVSLLSDPVATLEWETYQYQLPLIVNSGPSPVFLAMVFDAVLCMADKSDQNNVQGCQGLRWEFAPVLAFPLPSVIEN